MGYTNRFGSDRGPSYGDDNLYLDRDYNVGGGVSMENHEWDRGFGYHKEASYYGKGPKGWKLSDERIWDNVCEALTRNMYVDATDIEVEVSDGWVVLKGYVETRKMKREAERCVEGLLGVLDVQNEIRLRGNGESV